MGITTLYRSTFIFWLALSSGQAVSSLPISQTASTNKSGSPVGTATTGATGNLRQIKNIATPQQPTGNLSQPANTGSFQHNAPEGPGVKESAFLSVTEKSELSITLTYTAPELKIGQTQKNGTDHYSIELDGHTIIQEEGIPAIPLYSRLIDLSGREIVSVIISDVEYSRIYPHAMGYRGTPMPASAPGRKSGQAEESGQHGDQDQKRLPGQWVQQTVQDQNNNRSQHNDLKETYPLLAGNDTVTISGIGTIRGTTVGSLTIRSLFYYPNDEHIDLITGMTIEILFTPVTSEGTGTPGLKSTSLSGLLTKGLIGYDPEDVIPGFTLAPAGMVIVADSTMKRHLRPLTDWKTQKGFRVYEIYIGEGNIERSYSSIKDTLTKIFKSATPEAPAPEYLLLAGDLNYIPAAGGTSWLSDMYYGEYDGNGDYLPDLHTGRLPARDTTEMKAIVAKILQYEQFGFDEATSHYKSALAFTGYDNANINTMNGQVNYAAGYLTAENNITPHIFLHSSDDSLRTAMYDSVRSTINSGVGFINYTGHGDASGWLSTGMNRAWISTLTNKFRYPVVISNACQTANYGNPNNFGSAFVRSSGKGAVAFIGCSNDSYWNEDFYWSVGVGQITANPTYEDSGAGFYDRLFHTNGEKPGEWYFSLGQILYAGNLAVSESTSSKKKYYWETYTLLGDPSMMPWMGNPSAFEETLPDSIPRTLKSITLTTEPFAYVALSHFDTLWDASHASPTGAVSLLIPATEKDSCLVTLTGQNRIPLIKTIHFFDPDTAWLSINDINPDDATGNGNGKADWSEQISLDIDLQNAGGTKAADTYLLLRSDSPYLDILTDSLWVGVVEALTEKNLSAVFDIRIRDSVPDLEIISLDLTLNYGENSLQQRFDLSLHSPVPIILSSYADDTFTGNGNGLAEAGESVELTFRVTNSGSSAVSGVLYVTSLSEYLVINQASVPSGIIYPGETLELSVEATINEDTPEATNIMFSAVLDCYPYVDERELGLFSGRSTEDFEMINFTTFPWKNNTAYPWFITENESFQNTFAARSGLNSNNHSQKSVLSIRINLPEDDTLTFWYKVSSEYRYDLFVFEVDSIEQFSQSGITEWELAVVPLKKGIHRLNWVYQKDASLSEGEDCAWLDFIQFPEISFLKNDISLNRIIAPVNNVQYFDEKITVEVTNMGRDTITTLPLIYSINERNPVTEYFNGQILPGDTVSLSFREKADLSEAGSYFLTISPLLPDEYAFNDTVRTSLISYRYLIQVGPNPFSTSIGFTSQGYYENITVNIYSLGGKLMHIKKFDQFAPGERIEMDLSFLPAGSYILKVNTQLGTNIYKVVKVNYKP
ncbi:MAG: C25 family cysteine peptidase [Bacteroidales bacterium]